MGARNRFNRHLAWPVNCNVAIARLSISRALSFLLIGSGLYIIRTYLMDDKKILDEETVLMDEKSV